MALFRTLLDRWSAIRLLFALALALTATAPVLADAGMPHGMAMSAPCHDDCCLGGPMMCGAICCALPVADSPAPPPPLLLRPAARCASIIRPLLSRVIDIDPPPPRTAA